MFKKVNIKLIETVIKFFFNIIFFLEKNIRRVRKVNFDYFSHEYRFYNKNCNLILFGKDRFVSRETYLNGPADYHLFLRAKKILNKKIKFLIDVGANIGTFCIPAVKYGHIQKCIAIEPVAKINNILKVNIALNDLNERVKTYNYVISDKIKLNVSLKLNKQNYGDNKFKISKKKSDFKLKKLDSFLNHFPSKYLLIKIDIQGFEDKALNGSNKIISKKIPLLIEFDYKFIKSPLYFKIIKLLKKNYNFFSILDYDNPKREKIKNIDMIFKNLTKEKSHFNCILF